MSPYGILGHCELSDLHNWTNTLTEVACQYFLTLNIILMTKHKIVVTPLELHNPSLSVQYRQ